VAAAAGAVTMLIIRVAGRAGVAVGSIALLTLGNATSGGVLPACFLPGWLRPLSFVLPPGVAVRAIDGVAYFGNAGLTEGIAILAAWVLVPLLLIFLIDEGHLRGNDRARHARTPTAHALGLLHGPERLHGPGRRPLASTRTPGWPTATR
jgi:hypothetical protein